MRDQVRFLFSDSPRENLLRSLPNAIGCAEDLLHLVLRCKYCSGGRSTPCTRELMDIQLKFLNKVLDRDCRGDLMDKVYRGERVEREVEWEHSEPAIEVTPNEWTTYKTMPFISHEEYVKQLKRLAIKFEGEMSQKDGKGRSMLNVLQCGSSHKHYMYLFNNSIFQTIAQGSGIQSGTMSNEAEHRTLKRWTECVYKQHRDRLDTTRCIYALYRMLANSYKNIHKEAAYKYDEREVVCLLSGLIAGGALSGHAQQDNVLAEPATSRKDLKRPRKHVDQVTKDDQTARQQQRAAASSKQANMDLKAMKKVIKHRLTKKSSVSSTDVQPVRRRRQKALPVSSAIADIVERNISRPDL